jgi:hypothetical protein
VCFKKIYIFFLVQCFVEWTLFNWYIIILVSHEAEVILKSKVNTSDKVLYNPRVHWNPLSGNAFGQTSPFCIHFYTLKIFRVICIDILIYYFVKYCVEVPANFTDVFHGFLLSFKARLRQFLEIGHTLLLFISPYITNPSFHSMLINFVIDTMSFSNLWSIEMVTIWTLP